MQDANVLIVEDDTRDRNKLTNALEQTGCRVTAVKDGKHAIESLDNREFDLVVSKVRLPDMDGMQLLGRIKAMVPDTEVIIITGSASVKAAVAAMRKGAYQYLAKPVQIDELTVLAERALEKRQLRQEVRSRKYHLDGRAVPDIIGHSTSIQGLKDTIEQIAPVDCNVLILGETGTGKELVARSLHARSSRYKNRFIAVNCASFTEELLANELFGHEKEAYTGAAQVKRGLLEVADKGTFFLDEVGDMPLPMQANLLRVLQSKVLLRVGGTNEIPVDVRVIAATNKNLKEMVERGAFRKDLYYRLNVITLRVPALAQRLEDVPLLANFFLKRFSESFGKNINEIDDESMEALCSYSYPGNIRELENMIERAVVLCNGDTIGLSHLPHDIAQESHGESAQARRFILNDVVTLDELERYYLAWVLEQTCGNRTRAAELMGLNRGSLWRKLKRHRFDAV